MTDQGAPLPSFAKPPVNEVVLSVAFDRPAGYTIAHVGDFWRQHLRDEFPELEEQASYQPPVEVLGPPTPPVMNLQIGGRPPSPRLWAKSSDGTKIVQLQPDWLAFNWREGPQVDYPRWPVVEAAFLDQFRALRQYFADEGFGTMAARQCELTYVNQIRPGAVWTTHADLDQVFTVVESTETGFLPKPESLQFSMAFRMKSADHQDKGRLHVTVQPAFQREDNLPIIALTLVARGAPQSPDEAGVTDFLRLGHEWIVRGFADLTTAAMHEEWGRLT